MNYLKTAIASAALSVIAAAAGAASFSGYNVTGPTYYDGAGQLNYSGSNGSDVVSVSSPDLSETISIVGSLSGLGAALTNPYSPQFSGVAIDFSYTDNQSGDDVLAILFQNDNLLPSASDFAIATFTGELGSDFLTDGAGVSTPVFGTFEVVGAAVIPLPAALPLILAGLGGLAVVGRRRRRA
ncbi:MAG: VPLPA-CTERM sorting domain-containing protein [Pseudooceanicola sp.]